MKLRIVLCAIVYVVLFGLSTWIAVERGLPETTPEQAARLARATE